MKHTRASWRSRPLSLITILMLLMGSLLTTAPVATATSNKNLAGRPIDGSAYSWCHGLGYGKVNGKQVLWTANHCRPGGIDVEGSAVFGEGGMRLGTWHSRTVGAIHDLAYIELDAGNWPTNPNQVFKGVGWWTMGYKWGHAALDCNDIDNIFGQAAHDGVSQGYQASGTTQYEPVHGTVLEFYIYTNYTTCTVATSIQRKTGGAKDSGTPFFMDDYPTALFGVAHGYDPNTGEVYVDPIRDGILAYHNYWLMYGTQTGAWLCSTTACT